MRRIKLGLGIVGGVIMVVAVVLLLNFTAPNPTGRRYSSEMLPINNDQLAIKEKGNIAENILARDLGVPRNTGRQCFCSSDYTGGCSMCIVTIPLTSVSYRYVDFIGHNYFADSKNTQDLPGSSKQELTDYINVSLQLNMPFYIYTRVNTDVAPEFYELVRSTGGDVVHYFTVAGWIDPVDQGARIGVLVGIILLLLAVLLPARLPKLRFRTATSTPKTPKRKGDPLHKAIRSTDALDEFTQRTAENKQRDIDIEDSRGG